MIVPFLPPAGDHGPDIALRQPIDGPLAEEIGTFCEHNGVQLYPPWAKFYHGVAAAQDGDPRHWHRHHPRCASTITAQQGRAVWADPPLSPRSGPRAPRRIRNWRRFDGRNI